jgi:hypothetical protein
MFSHFRVDNISNPKKEKDHLFKIEKAQLFIVVLFSLKIAYFFSE